MSASTIGLSFETYGVPMLVEVEDPALAPAVRRTLPPGWTPVAGPAPLARFTVGRASEDAYRVVVDGRPISRALSATQAVQFLDTKLRIAVATRTPKFVFIHAGVVALEGTALVLPGRSFTGKSTLVEALLRVGATYYSDEFAVLDRDGHVHPYAKPLSRRPAGSAPGRALLESEEVDPRSLGAEIGAAPLPVSLIACATYRRGARWAPRRLGPAGSALALLQNAVAARTDPERVMAHVRRAADGCEAVEGERGEAGETVAHLVSELAALAPG